MKHKHAEMIKAKVDNMDFIVFCHLGRGWMETEEPWPVRPALWLESFSS